MAADLDNAAETFRNAMRDTVRQNSTLYLVQAAVLIIAGMAAIIFPAISSAVFVILLGWLLIISGVVQAVGLIGSTKVPNFWLQLISVVLAIWVGVLLLRHVGEGMVVITLLLIIFLMIDGVSKIVFALTVRPMTNWGWVLASGVLGVVLSLFLWASMPVTALWLIGLILGIQLISVGVAIGSLAWTLRKEAA